MFCQMIGIHSWLDSYQHCPPTPAYPVCGEGCSLLDELPDAVDLAVCGLLQQLAAELLQVVLCERHLQRSLRGVPGRHSHRRLDQRQLADRQRCARLRLRTETQDRSLRSQWHTNHTNQTHLSRPKKLGRQLIKWLIS